MLLLNVNNRSLTSTSEHAELSDACISDAAHLPSLLPLNSFRWYFRCRFVGRINIYKDKEEPVAR